MAKLVDAQDLKSWVPKGTYRFDSGSRHHFFHISNFSSPYCGLVRVGVAKSLELFACVRPVACREQDASETDCATPYSARLVRHSQIGNMKEMLDVRDEALSVLNPNTKNILLTPLQTTANHGNGSREIFGAIL